MGQIAGWSYLISRHSKNKEEAYRFIQWMMQPQNQIQQQLGGGASAMRSTYQDPRVRAIPYTDAYVATLGVARSMSGSVPETTRMSDILQVCLSDIVADRTTVAAGLDACARELGSLLRGKADLTCPVQDGGSATPTVRSEEKDS
jgi:ABC-type glycerol-3-phosphate transport system substrate-binding protein